MRPTAYSTPSGILYPAAVAISRSQTFGALASALPIPKLKIQRARLNRARPGRRIAAMAFLLRQRELPAFLLVVLRARPLIAGALVRQVELTLRRGLSRLALEIRRRLTGIAARGRRGNRLDLHARRIALIAGRLQQAAQSFAVVLQQLRRLGRLAAICTSIAAPVSFILTVTEPRLAGSSCKVSVLTGPDAQVHSESRNTDRDGGRVLTDRHLLTDGIGDLLQRRGWQYRSKCVSWLTTVTLVGIGARMPECCGEVSGFSARLYRRKLEDIATVRRHLRHGIGAGRGSSAFIVGSATPTSARSVRVRWRGRRLGVNRDRHFMGKAHRRMMDQDMRAAIPVSGMPALAASCAAPADDGCRPCVSPEPSASSDRRDTARIFAAAVVNARSSNAPPGSAEGPHIRTGRLDAEVSGFRRRGFEFMLLRQTAEMRAGKPSMPCLRF